MDVVDKADYVKSNGKIVTEIWYRLAGFDRYNFSNLGRVRVESTGKLIQPSRYIGTDMTYRIYNNIGTRKSIRISNIFKLIPYKDLKVTER